MWGAGQRQFHAKLALTDLPFVVGRGPVAREGEPPLHPNLKLDDTVPFRVSRNHFMIEKRDGSYYVHDLRSTLGTIVNSQPIGEHFRRDDAPLRAGENEVIAGGVDLRFVFSVFIAESRPPQPASPVSIDYYAKVARNQTSAYPNQGCRTSSWLNGIWAVGRTPERLTP